MQERRTTADPSPWRGTAFTVVSFVFGAVALGGLFGIGIVIGWFDNDEGGIHRVHDIAFGVTYGVLAATAFFALMSRRGRLASVVWQPAAVAAGVLIGSLISADFGYAVLAVILVVALAILIALLPERRGVLAEGIDLSVTLVAFAAVSAVPLIGAALTWARYQRDGVPIDPHVAESHWTTMSCMALALLLATALASARLPGWRFTAWCAAAGMVVYGVASIVFSRFPGAEVPYPGSEGVWWGISALVGGVVFAVLAGWEGRRIGGRR